MVASAGGHHRQLRRPRRQPRRLGGPGRLLDRCLPHFIQTKSAVQYISALQYEKAWSSAAPVWWLHCYAKLLQESESRVGDLVTPGTSTRDFAMPADKPLLELTSGTGAWAKLNAGQLAPVRVQYPARLWTALAAVAQHPDQLPEVWRGMFPARTELLGAVRSLRHVVHPSKLAVNSCCADSAAWACACRWMWPACLMAPGRSPRRGAAASPPS
jgi:hypothetical protein